MDFFSGFKWPVPLAFKAPLSNCRFEDGDMLHSDLCAYGESWGTAKKSLQYSVQVTSPMRSETSQLGKQGPESFARNWKSSVTFDLTNHSKGTVEEIRTTQGRLYSFLWKDEIEIIEEKGELELPFLSSDLHRELEKVSLSLKADHAFLMAVDLSNDFLLGKVAKLKNEFGENAELEQISAREISDKYQQIAVPTLEVAAFHFSIPKSEALKIVKKALYNPQASAKKSKRFNDRLHGVFLENFKLE